MTAGCSATPLAAKLGVKPGHRVALIGAPRDWTIPGVASDAHVARRRSSADADVVVAFFTSLAGLARGVAGLASTLGADASLWLAWPRRSSGHGSDLTDNEIRRAVLPLGLVDVKVAALDDDWSGLKMMWRKPLRPTKRGG